MSAPSQTKESTIRFHPAKDSDEYLSDRMSMGLVEIGNAFRRLTSRFSGRTLCDECWHFISHGSLQPVVRRHRLRKSLFIRVYVAQRNLFMQSVAQTLPVHKEMLTSPFHHFKHNTNALANAARSGAYGTHSRHVLGCRVIASVVRSL
jgi:hypothetical protein